MCLRCCWDPGFSLRKRGNLRYGVRGFRQPTLLIPKMCVCVHVSHVRVLVAHWRLLYWLMKSHFLKYFLVFLVTVDVQYYIRFQCAT